MAHDLITRPQFMAMHTADSFQNSKYEVHELPQTDITGSVSPVGACSFSLPLSMTSPLHQRRRLTTTMAASDVTRGEEIRDSRALI